MLVVAVLVDLAQPIHLRLASTLAHRVVVTPRELVFTDDVRLRRAVLNGAA